MMLIASFRLGRRWRFAALFAAPRAAAARDLTVVSWGGAYQDAQTKIYFEPFMKATGIKMIEESWNGGIGMLRAKVEGGNANWDVVQVETDELLLGCEEGLFEKIDYAKIGGKDDFLPAAVNDCGVGAIVYGPRRSPTTATSSKDAAEDAGPTSSTLKKFPGKRALRKGPKYDARVRADGRRRGAGRRLQGAGDRRRASTARSRSSTPSRTNIVWWEAGAQPPQLLASGEVVMTWPTTAGSRRPTRATRRTSRSSGTGNIYTIDSWVILKGSPEQGRRPEVHGLRERSEAAGATARNDHLRRRRSKAASSLIDPKVLPELPTAPENIAVGVPDRRGVLGRRTSSELNQRFNTWVAQVAAIESAAVPQLRRTGQRHGTHATRARPSDAGAVARRRIASPTAARSSCAGPSGGGK